MAYFFNTAEDQKEMLEAIGAASIGELFSSIPASLQLRRPLDIDPAMGELELTRHMSRLADANAHSDSHTCFMGAGSYDHFIPAVVF